MLGTTYFEDSIFMLCMPIFDHELGAINNSLPLSDLLALPLKTLVVLVHVDPKTRQSTRAPEAHDGCRGQDHGLQLCVYTHWSLQ